MTANTPTPNPMDVASTDTLRTADINDLIGLLERQEQLKTDFVAHPANLSYQGGLLVATDARPEGVDEHGDVVEVEQRLTLRPTKGFESDVSERLGIPHRYIEKMRDDAVAQWNATHAEDVAGDLFAADLLDHNVNHWLSRAGDKPFLIRSFHTDTEGEIGVARAMRSDRFGMYDHMDLLMATLSGVRAAGVAYELVECRLTERQMHVRITAPEVTAAAPLWTRNYRSPFNGEGGDLDRQYDWSQHGTGRYAGARVGDLVEAGVDIRNSETGDGSWYVAPSVRVLACLNGLTVKRDAFTRAHVGSKMEEGVVRYGDDTWRKNLELIKLQSRDAISSFLDVEYLKSLVAEIEEKAGAPVKDAQKTIERVAKKFLFSEEERTTILSAFIQSGQVNAAGVLNAVTATAQVVSADRATFMEEKALDVLDFVASAS